MRATWLVILLVIKHYAIYTSRFCLQYTYSTNYPADSTFVQLQYWSIFCAVCSAVCTIVQPASLLFVIDFGSLVFVSYQGGFVSYRYVEITITNGVIVIFFQHNVSDLLYAGLE